MIYLVHIDNDKEIILADEDGAALIFDDEEEAFTFIRQEDTSALSPDQQHIKLNQCIISHIGIIQELPEFLASNLEENSDEFIIIDSSDGTILSSKYCIVFADANAGYFIAKYGDNLVEKNNEYILYKNNNLTIIKPEIPSEPFSRCGNSCI